MCWEGNKGVDGHIESTKEILIRRIHEQLLPSRYGSLEERLQSILLKKWIVSR